MKHVMLIVSLMLMALVVTQCTKNPADTGSETDIYSEVTELNKEIIDLDQLVLEDSTDADIEVHMERALNRLNRLLDRAEHFVYDHDNDEAKALIDTARTIQAEAIAAAADSATYEEAFGLIRESAHLALEAVKIIKDEIKEEIKEDIITRLDARAAEVEALLNEVEALLDDEHPHAQHLFNRALAHFLKAEGHLILENFRRVDFHLDRAAFLATIALNILVS